MAEEEKHDDSTWAKVDAIVELLLDNDKYLNRKRIPELTEKVKEKFDVDTRQAQRYIKWAKAELRKITKLRKEKALDKALLDREYVINSMKKVKGEGAKRIAALKLALDAMKDRDDLQALYEHTKEKPDEQFNFNIDVTKLSTRGLNRLEAGENPHIVAADPTSWRDNAIPVAN